MRSIHAVVGAVGMALAISAMTAAPGAATPAADNWAARSCADPWKPADNSPDFWRWQAYHNLDCTIAFIDEHLGAAGPSESEDATVTISRDDLAKLRAMAITAKDAAQRIGH